MSQVRLVPVLELAPSDFKSENRASPEYPSTDEEWEQFWRDSLADSGIAGLQPIKARSWHVALNQLTEAHLEQVLRVYFQGKEGELELEFLGPLSGGYTLCVQERAWITPRCCSDLTDIEEWQAAAEYRSLEKKTIWIGHPWIEVRFERGQLLFTDTEEQGSQAEWAGECAVEPEALQQAVDQARQELQVLCQRLLPLVEKWVPTSLAAELTAQLTACHH